MASSSVRGTNEVHALLSEMRKPPKEQDPARLGMLRSRVILDEMFQFVGLLDMDGNLLDCNQTVLDAADIERDAVIDKPVWDTHWWDVSEQTRQDLQNAVQRAGEGELVRYDVKVRVDPRGHLRWIDFSCKPIHDADGNVVLLLPEGRDIHEQKLFEQELEEKNEQLQELDRLKSQMFANVSHELRTPLALILGSTENLTTHDMPPEDLEEVETIRRNALQLRGRVDDLLDIARLEAGRVEITYQHADLANLFRRTASNFEVIAHDNNITLTVNTPETLPAEFDPDKINRILTNLLSNAIKFTPENGIIRAKLEHDDNADEAKIIIADSGPGIPPGMRDAVFERFRQIEESSTRRSEGTGLGLAITKELTTLHHGTIGIQDAPEGGALFWVQLPLKAPKGTNVDTIEPHDGSGTSPAIEAAEAELTNTPTTPPDHKPHTPGQPTVLVVEDNDEMRNHIAQLLSDEFNIVTATDGEDGLEKAMAAPPDLVLTDIMMPRMSGDELVHRLRQQPHLSTVPIVLLTAKADTDLRVDLLESGAQDFVLKPFSRAELKARVRNLVHVKQASDQLRRELDSQTHDLTDLTAEVTERIDDLENALETAKQAI